MPAQKKDKFGYRIPSEAAMISACLTSRAQTAEQIAEKCSLTVSRVRDHLRNMRSKKLVEALYRLRD
jgi:predicted ArsR family transcriptional regulator